MRLFFLCISIFLLLSSMLMAFRSIGNPASVGVDVPTNNSVYTNQYRLIWPGNGTIVIGQRVAPVAFLAPRPFTLVPLADKAPSATPTTAYGFGVMSSTYATWFCMPSFVPPLLLNTMLLLFPWKKKANACNRVGEMGEKPQPKACA
jgi:hypothetical protein